MMMTMWCGRKDDDERNKGCLKSNKNEEHEKGCLLSFGKGLLSLVVVIISYIIL